MDPRALLHRQSHAEIIGPLADARGAEYPQRESNSRYEVENLAC